MQRELFLWGKVKILVKIMFTSCEDLFGKWDDSSTCGKIKFGDQTVYDGASWTTDLVNGNYGGLSLTVSTTTNDNDTWTLIPVS